MRCFTFEYQDVWKAILMYGGKFDKLHYSFWTKEYNEVHEMIAEGADVNECDREGSIIYKLLLRELFTDVKLLLDAGPMSTFPTSENFLTIMPGRILFPVLILKRDILSSEIPVKLRSFTY